MSLDLNAALGGPDYDTNVTLWSAPAGGAKAGGDWCEVVAISEFAVALTIGDVSGHGEDIAPPMVAVRKAVLQAIHDQHDPAAILDVANHVAATWGDGVLVTAIVAILDHQRHTLTFANAGHPPPLMLTPEAHVYLAHPPADLPLGLFPKYGAANYVIALPAEALVVFYTDGITEHERDPIAGEFELLEAARAMYGRPALNVARLIAHHVLSRGRGDDDAAVLALYTIPLTAPGLDQRLAAASPNGRTFPTASAQSPPAG